MMIQVMSQRDREEIESLLADFKRLANARADTELENRINQVVVIKSGYYGDELVHD